MSPQVVVDRTRLAEFCRQHHIRKMSFFGSVLGEKFRPDSDVDVLVEFEPEHVPGLLTLAGLEIELTKLLGRKADVRTAEDLSRYFRDDVVERAELVYAAA
jgi:uncharacterized protein